MNTLVLPRQSVMDLAISHTGSLEGAFLVAHKLGISITDDPTPSATLTILPSEVIDPAVVSYYALNAITPVTDLELRTFNPIFELQFD